MHKAEHLPQARQISVDTSATMGKLILFPGVTLEDVYGSSASQEVASAQEAVPAVIFSDAYVKWHNYIKPSARFTMPLSETFERLNKDL